MCVEDINAFGFIKLKLVGTVFTIGLGSSFNTVVEPGNRSIVLIGVDCCEIIGLSVRWMIGDELIGGSSPCSLNLPLSVGGFSRSFGFPSKCGSTFGGDD